MRFASSSLLAGRRRLRRSLPVSAAELPNDAVIDHAARLLQWSIRLRGGEQYQAGAVALVGNANERIVAQMAAQR